MAKKKLEEPEKWITVNGQHLPVYPGGVIGQPGQKEPKKDTTSKNNGNHWKDVNNYRDRLNAAKTEEEREKVLDEMDEAWKRIDHDKSLSDVEKNQLQSHMRDTRSGKGKKTASMDLGNGLHLTADVSNPNKNISEVERAKKVNREKYTADKGLYQHRNAVKAEQEKAQAIANAISAKTGIANSGTKTTSRNADDIYNERKNIKGNTQEEATRREKLSEELSRTVVSGMKSGEVYKVPSGKGYEELRYVGSEMKNNRAYATFETPNKSRTGIVKEGSDLYGIQSMKSSQPATTSRNAKYDTSRATTKKAPSYSTFEKQFLKESGEDVWNMSLERYNSLKRQARQLYNEKYGKKK